MTDDVKKPNGHPLEEVRSAVLAAAKHMYAVGWSRAPRETCRAASTTERS